MEDRETNRSFLDSYWSGLGWWDSISPPLSTAPWRRAAEAT